MFEVVEEYVNMNYEGLFWDLVKVLVYILNWVKFVLLRL